MVQQIGQQPAQVLAVFGQFVQLSQRGLHFAGQNGPGQIENLAPRREAEHRKHIALLNLFAAKADELVERGFRVAHSAVGAAGDGVQRRVVDLHFFLLRDLSQVSDDERRGNPAQVESLATREDRRQDFLRLGRRKHELHVPRRLFKRLEKRVERLLG